MRTVDALGNVHYDDNQVILKGPKAWSNLNTKDTNVWQGDYQMVGRQGRGTADLMKQRGENRYTILENGSFTSCLPGSDTWSVVGSEVIHDREEQVAEIWNARFKLGSVPIFYSPYLQLPVGDKRRSGFLIPNAKYSTKNGVEFSLPYYWNIAPNFDATITPHYMNKRGGVMWENEFRYLTQLGSGLTEFDYLPSDKVYEDDHSSDSNSRRWLFYWNHSGVIDQVWRLNADYTKVSDPDYFNDFSSKYGSSTDGYATQKFSAGYVNQNFDATVSTKQFQVFDRESSNSYSAEPQLDVNYYQNDVGPFDTHLYGQVAHFVNSNNNMPEATRVHFEPTINLPLSNGWGSLNTEAKLLATHYQQSNLDKYNAANGTDYKESVSRVMPQFKVDGKMVFERDLQEGFTQTLEPRVQYLYVPYRDQSEIGNYDSTLLQSDYTGLSATVPIAVWTASRRLIRSPPGSPRACMMPPRWNVLIFPLVKSTISPSHAPVMTTSTGRTTIPRVHWSGPAIPTGALPMNGVCAEGSSTIRVWITLPLVTAPLNTVAMRTA